MPYLGCREFAASFGEPLVDDRPINHSDDLGLMLFDMSYRHDEEGRGVGGEPTFFHARLENGVLKVPAELYEGEV